MKSPIVWLAGLLGIVFVVLALYYWMTPAGSLATFIPGYESGVATVHFKHGLASLILGLGLFVLAWFKSAPGAPATDSATPPLPQ